MIRYYIILLFFTIGSSSVYADDIFRFTPELKTAYDAILSLRLEEGQRLIEQIKIEDPNNALVYLVEDYIDFFTVFIGEEESDFKRLEKNKKIRLEKIKKASKASPYYLYSQAEINLHWALIRTKFEQKFKAFNEINTAYDLLNENHNKYPDFIANKKSLGVLHAALGTIPDKYKWGVKLLSGMAGDIQQGCIELEEVIDYGNKNQFLFKEETLVLYAFMQLHLKNDSDKAYRLIKNARLQTDNNPLACFVKANVAMRSGHTDEAIELLLNRPKGDQYFPFHYLDFTLGLAKLQRLDDDADLYLKQFIKNFSGRNYIKEAYQKLAWYNLIIGNKRGYEENVQECIYSGFSIIDEDKNAKREALKGQVPHMELLKVRMLTDGGYYSRALELIENLDIGFSEEEYLQYQYRKARLLHQLFKYEEAIVGYESILDTWRDNESYMICNSALQVGLIKEAQEDYNEAKRYFKLALSIDPEQYKTGLHQKAKAGLNRVDLILE